MLGNTTDWSVSGLFGALNKGVASATKVATSILTAQGNLQNLRNQQAQAKIAVQSAAMNNSLIQAQIAQIGAQSLQQAAPSQNVAVQPIPLTPEQSTVLALANQNAGMSPTMLGLLALGGLLVFKMAAK